MLQPLAAGGEFSLLGRVAAWKGLQQAHRAEREAVAKVCASTPPKYEFGAATANIHEQQGRSGELRVGGHSLKPQCRLLLARDDFDLQPGGLLDGGGQLTAVHRLARNAGGQDANRGRLGLTGHSRKASN